MRKGDHAKVSVRDSSPRKDGNSDVLCECFAAGVREVDHEVEMVLLRGKKIAPAPLATLVWKATSVK